MIKNLFFSQSSKKISSNSWHNGNKERSLEIKPSKFNIAFKKIHKCSPWLIKVFLSKNGANYDALYNEAQ